MTVFVLIAGVGAFTTWIGGDWNASAIQLCDQIVNRWCWVHDCEDVVFGCVYLINRISGRNYKRIRRMLCGLTKLLTVSIVAEGVMSTEGLDAKLEWLII